MKLHHFPPRVLRLSAVPADHHQSVYFEGAGGQTLGQHGYSGRFRHSMVSIYLGKAEARRLIVGTSYAYKTEAEAATAPPTMKQFADAHGTPTQRFYNLLCIAYGADAQLFGDMVEEGHLPKDRAEDCKDEYRQVAYAYEKLVGQHIDPILAKTALDKNWLPDAKWRVPRRPGSAQTK